MALIRNDKHDTRNDKHGQPTDSNEQRKEKHEHRKRKDLTHEGPNQNPENTYVSYRDSEADIEYTLTRKDVISNNGLAEQSVDLIDTSKEQAQEYQRNFKELSENDIVKQTDMSKVRSQSNGEQSGTVILEEQNGAIRNGDENSRMRVADQSGTERIVKQSGAVRNNEHCESEIVWDRSGSRSWTKSDEKACLLGVSSLTYESKSELKNEQLLMAGTMYTVDTGIANSCADGNDLEGAKDKVFGKKRVLTEVLSNAYSIKSKPNVETYDFEGQKSDIADRYMYDKTNFKNKYMTKLNTNARVKIDVDRDDYVNGNGYFQECEVVSPADLLNNEKKCNVQKDKTEEDNCTVTKGENNVHNTGLEHSHNGINKASTISDQEQKVHRYIDETSEQQDSLDFDNTVKSAYEELNMSRHGTASDNIETNGTRYTDVDQQNLPAEPHSGDDVPRNRRRNGKDKKLNKDNYATESRAALRAKTKTNALHRRYASEGALGSNLENLFQGTKWRPLSTNFQDYIATVAIDFGTAYSGYAYCLTHFPG